MWTAQKGHLEIARLLLDRGANMNASRTDSAATSLIIASELGHLEIVRLLLANGAHHYSQLTNSGCSALLFACWKGHTDIVRLLCSYGANVNLPAFGVDNGVNTVAGNTPLMIASREGHHKAVSVLLEFHADKGAVDSKGKTALKYAAKHPLVLSLLKAK